ncbi:11221_t:CDS:2 [Ambispora gerdemannii]|uniref:11221_t:CDS:1 n=1 Tax=Ambispora gerdemannii TaxID=144530 RepID=A0A9N8VK53_9GLOM|nr:11221_t:CDS:2 [Ambispora gerdemannii]
MDLPINYLSSWCSFFKKNLQLPYFKMSEFWVSQAKHWCQYCRIYIADNKPSRSMHESGRKHKENVEKFLRNIYRHEEETKKEDDKVKRELQRIEHAAMRQYKKDVGLAETGASLNTLRSAIDSAVASAPPPSTDEREAYYKTSLPSSSTLHYSNTVAATASESDSLVTVTSIETTEVMTEDSQIAIVAPPNKPEDRGDGSEPVIGEWRPVTPPPLPLPVSTDATAASSKQGGKSDDKTNIVEKTLPINNDKSIAVEKVTLKKRKIDKGGKQPKKIRKKSYD